jgi:UDP-N-acetylglucosamine 2-epimerase (hydrolysing)
MFHPVTTEIHNMEEYVHNFVNALLKEEHNYIVIFPNNDLGSKIILREYKRLYNKERFRIIPSLRFEYFLTLLKNARFIIGNSSAGIREAPYYGLPIINIGTRQQNRAIHANIINTSYCEKDISRALHIVDQETINPSVLDFGNGNSAELFLNSLLNQDIWELNHQKQFRDI